jgi:hypothetical protein
MCVEQACVDIIQLTMSASHGIFSRILNKQLSLRPTWSLGLLHLLILVRVAPFRRFETHNPDFFLPYYY